jgi:hypothetical protein
MKICCLQFAPQLGTVDDNIRRADEILDSETASKHFSWLILPELAFSGTQCLSPLTCSSAVCDCTLQLRILGSHFYLARLLQTLAAPVYLPGFFVFVCAARLFRELAGIPLSCLNVFINSVSRL